jgi:tetratricopeptide (TPR) repeat protein/peptidoglycan/xylan/chitin deacetylase (PgdA/CDA1 family)
MSSWKCVAQALFLTLLLPCSLHAQANTPSPTDATALTQQGKLEQATQAWHSIIQRNPKDAAAYASLGFVLSREQKYPEAAIAYRKAIALNPNLPGVQLNLGLAEFKQGHSDAAVSPLRSARAADPHSLQATTLLGLSYYGSKHFEDAVTYLQIAAASDSDNKELHLTLAQSCLSAKKYSCALEEFKKLEALDPNSSAVHLRTGRALDGEDKTEEAIAEFQEAVKLAPQEPNLHLALGYEYWKAEKYDQPVAALQAELAIVPDNAQALAYLGDIALKQGDEAKAAVAQGRPTTTRQPSGVSRYRQYSGGPEAVSGSSLRLASRGDPQSRRIKSMVIPPSIRCSSCLFLLVLSLSSLRDNNPPPVHLTTDQDHQRLLDLLHITSLRRGPDADPKSPYAANFDESRVSPNLHLPDPLLLKNGTKVTTEQVWWKQRRPEIVEDFDREIYGRVPNNTPKVHWEVVSTTNEANHGVPVITKKLIGHVENSSYPLIAVNIQLMLTTPAKAAGPVPVMMEFGLSPEVLEALKKRLTPEQLAAFTGKGPTWQQQVLAMGWGYAVLIPTSVQADNGAGLTEGIIGLVNKGQPRKLDDWGALRAWAWGASRALDYFETDKAVDAKQVGIEGLSRYGKAALITMAYDSRFVLGFIGSSGAGGAKILRRNFGEQVENIASTGGYHWMAGNFLKYAGPLTVNDMPVDAHELVALCAPRPVFISSGSQQMEGGWVDAKGMFLGALGAGPVYKLLGKKDLGTTEFPPIETTLIDGDIAFRQHTGGHTTGPNWPTFLTFASRYIKGPPVATAATNLREVALTFDDLPAHGPLPPGMTRVDIANSIIRALQAAHASATYGLVNAKSIEQDPSSAAVLQLWRAAGYPLANHTFSHMDLDTNSAEAFEQDIIANEPILKEHMGNDDWHWLRFPFLHEGDSPAKHRAIEEFLTAHGYRVAQVTISFGDYAYNAPYARCLAKNDQQGIEQLKQSYMEGASQSLEQGRTLSNLVFGREIKHVMLLHIGSFETVMLPQLLDLLKQRGFILVTLPEAESDPAYSLHPDVPSNWGGTFLDQMIAARHVAGPNNGGDALAKLDGLCR